MGRGPMLTKINIILAVLLWASTCFSQVTIGAGGISISGFSTGGTAATPAYLVSEDFEGAGYENSWTESGGGTIDEDYTTTVLVGSQSLGIVNASGQTTNYAYTNYTAQDNTYVYLRFRTNTLSVQREIVNILDSSNNSLCLVQAISTNDIRATTGGGSVATVGMITNNVEYHFWVRYSKGTGSNGVCSVGFSTDGTEPTSGDNFVSKTNSTSTAQGSRLFLGGYANSTSILRIYDKIRVLETSIGSNPQ